MEPFCSNSLLWKLAFDSKFVVRARDLQPQMLLLAALQVMDHPSEISIEALYSAYRESCIDHDLPEISDTAFRKQINKDKFENFARALFETIAKGCTEYSFTEGMQLLKLIQRKLPGITNLVVSDGSEIRLSDQAALIKDGKQRNDCKGVVGTCQIKVHGSFSLIHQSLEHVSLTKGTGAERAEVPLCLLRNCLWFADAGYIDFDILKTITEQHSFFLVRGKQNMNPMVKSITMYKDGNPSKTKYLAHPTSLKELASSLDPKSTYDMEVILSNGLECRVIRSYVPDINSSKRGAQKKKNKPKPGFAYYYTNLPQELFDVPQVLALYRLRWSIELCWRAHKSFSGLKTSKVATLSTVRGMFYLSLACQALKTLLAQLVEPYLGGKKLSLLKVSAHSGRVLLETVEHILFDGHASIDWLKKLDKTAKKLMWNMSRRIKLIPSKTNRAKGKGVFCVIKELQRKTRVPLRALT